MYPPPEVRSSGVKEQEVMHTAFEMLTVLAAVPSLSQHSYSPLGQLIFTFVALGYLYSVLSATVTVTEVDASLILFTFVAATSLI